MHTIINPITKEGKVKCLHYYEVCLKGKWFECFIAIFIFNEQIYLYKFERVSDKRTIVCFGDISSYHMTAAIGFFKNLII